MIRKLRKKFILINMLLIACLMLAAFVVIGVISWRESTQETLQAMRMNVDGGGLIQDEEEHKLELNGNRGDRPPLVATFSVLLNSDNSVNTIQGSYIEVTQEAAEQAVQAALADGEQDGLLWSLRLRYLVGRDFEGNRRIVFADFSDQLGRMQRLVLTMLLVGTAAMAALLGISVFLARVAVRPVEEAWARQRQFVADASHELKTPLTVILANSGILLSRPEETIASQRRWVENTREEAQRMRRLVDDMLFLAKSDDGQQPTPHVPLSLSDLVWSAELTFEAVAFEQGVALECQVEDGLQVLGDETQLRQLVGILLDNGCKYAASGGAVSLRLTRQRDKACLTVQNTGSVIPGEQLAHIFERFYRADPSRARTQGGYGLGLAIAQSVAKAHGGTLKARSNEAEGTVFTFLMDAQEVKAAQ